MNKFSGGTILAAVIAFLVGAFGGYAISEVRKSGKEIDLEQEITRLKDEALQKTSGDAPNDEEASAAIAKSGGLCGFLNANRVRPCRV